MLGIKFYTLNDDDNIDVLYEKLYNTAMNKEQIKRAYMFYTSIEDKPNILCKIYKECSTTYDVHSTSVFMWYSCSLREFVEKYDC